jgi:undecaprenyl-diphosphatase
MSIIEAIILGLIQGITEFLPVSSSGHLQIGNSLFGLDQSGGENLSFSVVVHAGTALSTIVIFRKDIVQIINGLLKFKWNDETKFAAFILISMMPVTFLGLFYQKELEELFNDQLLLVGAMLFVTGVLLYLADRAKETNKEVRGVEAFIIGLGQAVSVLPGLSRSGTTISTSVLLGIDRRKAARFSFLMVLPVIFGKMILEIKKITESEAVNEGLDLLPLLLGFFAAFVTGLMACKWMIALVRRAKLKYFSLYCFVVAGVLLVYELV